MVLALREEAKLESWGGSLVRVQGVDLHREKIGVRGMTRSTTGQEESGENGRG